MKKALLAVGLVLVCAAGEARSTRVKGYTRSDGTYVAPYTRTTPNSTRMDNYSTKGNSNPYTGKSGSQPLLKPLK